MHLTIRRSGRSLGIVLPMEVCQTLGLRPGDTLAATTATDPPSLRLAVNDAELSRQLALAASLMRRYHVTLARLSR